MAAKAAGLDLMGNKKADRPHAWFCLLSSQENGHRPQEASTPRLAHACCQEPGQVSNTSHEKEGVLGQNGLGSACENSPPTPPPRVPSSPAFLRFQLSCSAASASSGQINPICPGSTLVSVRMWMVHYSLQSTCHKDCLI